MATRSLSLFLAGTLCLSAQHKSLQPAISGPYSHASISIFLIHQSGATVRETKPSPSRYLTLQAALEQKRAVVYETSQVNELAIENTSTVPIFLQQGDIVRGGKQDRMISNDYVLPPKSGRVPLSAFCVEQGRWSQRGSESVHNFTASTELAAVRFEPKAMWNQLSVWNKVAALQGALAARLEKSTGLGAVVNSASPTSLMLTQTSPPIEAATGAYTAKLSGILAGKTDVVGYAFAVNGELKGADVYASPELFTAMWPKLLKSSVMEAIRLPNKNAPPPGTVQVRAFLSATESAKENSKTVGNVKLVARENDQQVSSELRDSSFWVHRSVLKK